MPGSGVKPTDQTPIFDEPTGRMSTGMGLAPIGPAQGHRLEQSRTGSFMD